MNGMLEKMASGEFYETQHSGIPSIQYPMSLLFLFMPDFTTAFAPFVF